LGRSSKSSPNVNEHPKETINCDFPYKIIQRHMVV